MDYSNVLLDLMNRVIELEKRVSKLEAERREYLRGEPQTKVTAEEIVAKGYESDVEPKKRGRCTEPLKFSAEIVRNIF